MSARASLWKPMNQITAWQVKNFQKYKLCKVSSSVKYPRWHVTSLRFLFSHCGGAVFPLCDPRSLSSVASEHSGSSLKNQSDAEGKSERTGSAEHVGRTERGGRFLNTSQACLCVWIPVCWRWDNRRAQLVWFDPAWQVKEGESCIKAPIRKFNRI